MYLTQYKSGTVERKILVERTVDVLCIFNTCVCLHSYLAACQKNEIEKRSLVIS